MTLLCIQLLKQKFRKSSFIFFSSLLPHSSSLSLIKYLANHPLLPAHRHHPVLFCCNLLPYPLQLYPPATSLNTSFYPNPCTAAKVMWWSMNQTMWPSKDFPLSSSALKDLLVTSYMPLDSIFFTCKSVVAIIHGMLERALVMESEYLDCSLSPAKK